MVASTPRIVIHNDATEGFVDQLLHVFPQADFRTCTTYEGLPELIGSYEPEVIYSVRFAGTPGFPRDAIFGSSSINWVANGGAGTDHFGIWDPASVTVTNAAGVAADMMAEYILGGFMHFTLDIAGLLEDKANRNWANRCVSPLKGNVLLIVGLGQTGQALAKRAKAFGMRVIGTRMHPRPMADVDKVFASEDLLEALSQADFIAVSTPLTEKTRGLLSIQEFFAMKQGAILADVSRGGVIDQAALISALTNGKLKAAVLDVFETEPLPEDSPFWEMSNVLVSPHCSSVYEGWEQASFSLFLENLERWIKGRSLKNQVDPKLGY